MRVMPLSVGRRLRKVGAAARTAARGVVLAGVVSACATAPPPEVGPSYPSSVPAAEVARPGVLVMAHGGSEAWNASVEAAVEPLADRVPTAVAFGMAKPETMSSAVAELETAGVTRIAVVRLFLSGESFLHPTEYLLGKRADAPARWPMHDPEASVDPIPTAARFAIDPEGLVDADETGRILRRRALAMSRDPGSEAVLVLGHGNGDETVNRRLLEKMEARVAPLRADGFREVRVETLREDWAEAREAAERRIRDWVAGHTEHGTRVLVVPMRLSGFGPYAEVLEGLDYHAEGIGLLPDPAIGDWLVRRTRAVFCANDWRHDRLSCPLVAQP